MRKFVTAATVSVCTWTVPAWAAGAVLAVVILGAVPLTSELVGMLSAPLRYVLCQNTVLEVRP